MLEAFIIDQLKKEEEKEWETLVPTLEVPIDLEEDSPTPPEKPYKWVIDFN